MELPEIAVEEFRRYLDQLYIMQTRMNFTVYACWWYAHGILITLLDRMSTAVFNNKTVDTRDHFLTGHAVERICAPNFYFLKKISLLRLLGQSVHSSQHRICGQPPKHDAVDLIGDNKSFSVRTVTDHRQ
ncbi:hypothetical protein evm_008357 [Chilo suppressalis]|nr:hypothetical protein evm_008357 [Chilo suppressalis]